MSASAAEVNLEFLFSLSGGTAAAKADFSKIPYRRSEGLLHSVGKPETNHPLTGFCLLNLLTMSTRVSRMQNGGDSPAVDVGETVFAGQFAYVVSLSGAAR